MNSKITALLVAAALCAATVVSCGKDETSSSDVVLDINNSTTSSSETTTTAEKNEATTTTAVTTKDAKKSTTTTSDSKKPATTTTAVADNNNNEPDDNDEQDEDNQSYDDPQPDEPQNNQPDPEPQQPQRKTDYSVSDLLSNSEAIISTLGAPDYSGKAPACTQNGKDVMIYQYSGLEIQCYVDGEAEYIFDIKITGGEYSTSAGIRIGSSRSDVENIYGSGEGSGDYIIYPYDDSEMDIQYINDTVVAIEFYVPV